MRSPYHVIVTVTDGLTTTQIAFDWTIKVAPPAMPGNFDGDSAVTHADYYFWKANVGATTLPGLSADANGNGVVDVAEYTIWREISAKLVSGPLAGPACLFIVSGGVRDNDRREMPPAGALRWACHCD